MATIMGADDAPPNIPASELGDESRDDLAMIVGGATEASPPVLLVQQSSQTGPQNEKKSQNSATITIAKEDTTEIIRTTLSSAALWVHVFETWNGETKIGDSNIIISGSSHDNGNQKREEQQDPQPATNKTSATDHDIEVRQTALQDPLPGPSPIVVLSAAQSVVVVEESSGDAVETVKASPFMDEGNDKDEEQDVPSLCRDEKAEMEAVTLEATSSSPNSSDEAQLSSPHLVVGDDEGLEIVNTTESSNSIPKKENVLGEKDALIKEALDLVGTTTEKSNTAAARGTFTLTENDTRDSSGMKEHRIADDNSTSGLTRTSVSNSLGNGSASIGTFISTACSQEEMGIEVDYESDDPTDVTASEEEQKMEIEPARANSGNDTVNECLGDIRALLMETETPLLSLNTYYDDDGEGFSIDEKYFLDKRYSDSSCDDSSSGSNSSIETESTTATASRKGEAPRRTYFVPPTVSRSFGTLDDGRIPFDPSKETTLTQSAADDDDSLDDLDDETAGSMEFLFLDDYDSPDHTQAQSGRARVEALIRMSSPRMEEPSQKVFVQEENGGNLETRAVIYAKGLFRRRGPPPLSTYGKNTNSSATYTSSEAQSSADGRRVAVRVDEIGTLETSLVGNLACPTEDESSVWRAWTIAPPSANRKKSNRGRDRPPRHFWHNPLRRKSSAKRIMKPIEESHDEQTGGVATTQDTSNPATVDSTNNKQQALLALKEIGPFKKQTSGLVVRSFNNKEVSFSSEGEEDMEKQRLDHRSSLSDSGILHNMSDRFGATASSLGTRGLKILKAVGSRASSTGRIKKEGSQILDEVHRTPTLPTLQAPQDVYSPLDSDSSTEDSTDDLESTDAGVVPSVIAYGGLIETSVPSQGTSLGDDIVPLAKDDRCRSEHVILKEAKSVPAPRCRSDGIFENRQTNLLGKDHDDAYISGCNLLRQVNLGSVEKVRTILEDQPTTVSFSDYDRRTALHVAASEGNVKVCRLLIAHGSPLNRSDRWGNSPLDDAQRLHHEPVLRILRAHQARTGSTDKVTNLLAACEEGDMPEVRRILDCSEKLDIERKDYDGRQCMHLAASRGNLEIVKLLYKAGASVNSENRWGRRPLDKALDGSFTSVAGFLKQHGAKLGETQLSNLGSGAECIQTRETGEQECILVGSDEVELLDLIGSGTFGDVYKCTFQGEMAVAKLISAQRVRQAMSNNKKKDLDHVIEVLDEAESLLCEKDEHTLEEFRDEFTVTKTLRHPNIVRLLAYTTTTEYEIPIYELMHWSLSDLLQFHGKSCTELAHERQIQFAIEIAQGMSYLHSRDPPIFHGDLKPSSLLIDASGTLKIADVGLAKIIPDIARDQQSHGNTATYRFIAPELIRNEEFGPPADVYSFAMVLYNLLDGLPPWPDMNGIKAATLAAEKGERPELRDTWDPRLRFLISECWKGEPSDRPRFDKILSNLMEYQDDFLSDTATATSQCTRSTLRPYLKRMLRKAKSSRSRINDCRRPWCK